MKQKISFKRGDANAPAVIRLAITLEVGSDRVPEAMADIGEFLAKHLTGEQAAEFLENLRRAKAEYDAEIPGESVVSSQLVVGSV